MNDIELKNLTHLLENYPHIAVSFTDYFNVPWDNLNLEIRLKIVGTKHIDVHILDELEEGFVKVSLDNVSTFEETNTYSKQMIMLLNNASNVTGVMNTTHIIWSPAFPLQYLDQLDRIMKLKAFW
jgi:hypothetical protein